MHDSSMDKTIIIWKPVKMQQQQQQQQQPRMIAGRMPAQKPVERFVYLFTYKDTCVVFGSNTRYRNELTYSLTHSLTLPLPLSLLTYLLTDSVTSTPTHSFTGCHPDNSLGLTLSRRSRIIKAASAACPVCPTAVLQGASLIERFVGLLLHYFCFVFW
jgi:hypothetical protein